MGRITKIMRSSLCLLIMVTAALAAKSHKRTKPPYIADAVGNALPPPSVVPATVGSPVNLLTPDRYEFYTFDESGELVKRLMTLEEIQAIVAAGEDGDTPVTFDSNDNPTIAFNFSQPSNTKVHSVVTNVQNVLKAQMEAHRNKPYVPPTLDTPDVSDSWSLILPSIFGNSDVDILPDKSSTATTPEPETFIIDSNDNYDHLSKEGSNQIPGGTTLTDKYNNDLLSENISSPEKGISENEIPTTTTTTTTTTERPTTTTTTTTTTKKPTTTTTTTTKRPTTTTTTTTTTKKPTTTTTTTTKRPTTTTTTTTTTKRPTTTTTTTTKKPATTTTTTTKRPTTTTTTTTTKKPTTTTTTTTTEKPTTTTTTTTTIKPTTRKPTTTTKYTTAETTTKPSTTTTTTEPITTTTRTSTKRATTTTAKPSTTTTIATTNIEAITTKTPQFIETFMSTTYKTSGDKDDMIKETGDISESNFVKLQIPEILNPMPADENNEIKFEKISTFIPVSTINFVTEKSTYQPDISTVHITVLSENDTTEKNSPSTIIAEEKETTLMTTVTTQSVSPFTTVSSTETSILDDTNFYNSFLQNKPGIESENNNDFPELPMLPLFDVAQSFSQIASDLGGNYQPLPTVNNLLDTTKYNPNNFESKENLEIDIPSAADVKEKEISTIGPELNNDNFVKISTLDPQSTKDNNRTNVEIYQSNDEVKLTTPETLLKEESTSIPVQDTTMDPVLSGSMNDLLSQIVNQAAQSIIDKNTETTEQNDIKSTENIKDITTAANVFITNTTFENYDRTLNDISSTTEISEKYSNVNIDVTTDIITTIKEKNNENDINFFENTEATEKPAFTENADNIYMEIPLSTSRENLIKESYTLNDKFDSESNVYKEVADKQENELTTDLNITTDNLETTTINQLTTDPIEIVPTTQIINIKADSKPVTDNKLENLVKFNTTKKYKPSFLPKVDDPINIEEFKKKIQKVNIAEEELISERNNSWKLISTGSPPRGSEISKDKVKYDNYHNHENHDKDIVLEFSKENQGLEVTTKDLEEDIAQFTELCNELAFRYWDALVQNIDKKRSFVISPFSITSMLAMMFMGARGSTSGEMNEILKLDDMVTFNPHFTFKNISDSIETTPQSGIIVSAFIRELYSDRNKGKILTFYKERAQHFYNGHVEEINFKLINDIIRRRTNLLVKRFSWGRIPEFMKTNTISLQPPLAAFSANIFQTDCTGSSVDGRDGEMYFVVSPNVRQRRLVPVPAVVYRAGFLAGYDPVLDATAAAVGTTNSVISTLFLMPGQQGNVVHADDLENLEKRLLNANPTTPTWNRLLRTLLPRIGLELQIPRFSHKSLFNVSSTLKQMGLNDLFDADHADLGGLNGPSKDLYLSDMIQWTTFVTCGEGTIGEQHHIEEYPELLEVKRRRSSRWVHNWDEPRDYQRAFHDPHDVGEAMNLPLHLRPRQARLPSRITQPARLKYDRPFLYFVRHNPSGMILYVGRYNPRLLP